MKCIKVNSDDTRDLTKIDEIFKNINTQTTLQDRKAIKQVCQIIGTRAARLSAVGVACLSLKTVYDSKLVVAIDGSVFEHYPNFEQRMRQALEEMLGVISKDIILEQATDGSGRGAAIIAALA